MTRVRNTQEQVVSFASMGRFGETLVFPQLLSEDEIDAMIEPPAVKVVEAETRYQPIAVIRAAFPKVADQLAPLWGTDRLSRAIGTLLEQAKTNPKVSEDVKTALLVLRDYHGTLEGRAGAITDFRPAPTKGH